MKASALYKKKIKADASIRRARALSAELYCMMPSPIPKVRNGGNSIPREKGPIPIPLISGSCSVELGGSLGGGGEDVSVLRSQAGTGSLRAQRAGRAGQAGSSYGPSCKPCIRARMTPLGLFAVLAEVHANKVASRQAV